MKDSKILILGLHRVGMPAPSAKIKGLFISPKLLELQLMLIQAMGFRFTTLRDALSAPREKNAVITFDDGYLDNFTHGFPLLRKFGAPATIFVITKNVGQKNVTWREAGEDSPADIIDWKSLAKLQDHGWEIGSHAHRHIHLARYDEADQELAIWQSIVEIKKNLGIRPVSFAYPYGSYNENTKRILKRLGMKYAVTTNTPDHKKDFWENDFLELDRCALGGRKFHHYVKNFIRIQKSVGKYDSLKALLFQPHLQIFRFLNSRSSEVSSLSSTNDEIVPRQ